MIKEKNIYIFSAETTKSQAQEETIDYKVISKRSNLFMGGGGGGEGGGCRH